MICDKCKKESDFLLRVNPLGENGIFWCENCTKINEPELYKNEMEDGLLQDLKDILT